MWLATTVKAILRLRNLFSCLGLSWAVPLQGAWVQSLVGTLRSHMPHGLAKRKTKMEPPCCRQGGWGQPKQIWVSVLGLDLRPHLSLGALASCSVPAVAIATNHECFNSLHVGTAQQCLRCSCVTCPHSYPGASLLRLKHEAPVPSGHQGLYNP